MITKEDAVSWIWLLMVALVFPICILASEVIAEQIPIAIRVNDTAITLYDTDNTQVFNLTNFTAVFNWRVNASNGTQLSTIADLIQERCTNLSEEEIRNTLNQRLDTKLSEFEDRIDVKLTPIIDYGDRFKSAMEENGRLLGQLNEKNINETKLFNEWNATEIELAYCKEETHIVKRVTIALIVVLAFVVAWLSGFLNKAKQWFGGKPL